MLIDILTQAIQYSQKLCNNICFIENVITKCPHQARKLTWPYFVI